MPVQTFKRSSNGWLIFSRDGRLWSPREIGPHHYYGLQTTNLLERSFREFRSRADEIVRNFGEGIAPALAGWVA